MSEVKDTARSVAVTAHDLPLHCPQPDAPLWARHPRVFLDVLKNAAGLALILELQVETGVEVVELSAHLGGVPCCGNNRRVHPDGRDAEGALLAGQSLRDFLAQERLVGSVEVQFSSTSTTAVAVRDELRLTSFASFHRNPSFQAIVAFRTSPKSLSPTDSVYETRSVSAPRRV